MDGMGDIGASNRSIAVCLAVRSHHRRLTRVVTDLQRAFSLNLRCDLFPEAVSTCHWVCSHVEPGNQTQTGGWISLVDGSLQLQDVARRVELHQRTKSRTAKRTPALRENYSFVISLRQCECMSQAFHIRFRIRAVNRNINRFWRILAFDRSLIARDRHLTEP